MTKHLVKAAATAAFLSLSLGKAFALTHTWVGPTVVESSDTSAKVQSVRPEDATQTVVVTGSIPSISFGPGSFDVAFVETPVTFQGGNGIANAIASGVAKALKLTHSCTNPGISAENKSTTGSSDMTDRWLAASAIFSTVQGANLLGMAGKAYNGIGLAIGGVQYAGFKVYYKDGASEVWAINPAAGLSSDKLIDAPMPGSLTGPSAKDGC